MESVASIRSRVRKMIRGRTGSLLSGEAPVYLVGGALRDLLGGRKPRDYDLLVRSDDIRLSSIFPEGRWVGRSHRTLVLPLSGKGGKGGALQIGTYEGGLEPELGRRDFSVNAMALQLGGTGDCGAILVDPFGGIIDLERGLLRRPDPARNPFAEDPVRVVRLVRFVSERGFSVEPDTLSMAQKAFPGLTLVAGERLREECLKLFSGRYLDRLARTFPPDFLCGLFSFLSGGDVGRESPGELLAPAFRTASRISRSDPLFRLWIFFRIGGYQRRGRAHLSVLTRLPWSREERGRLARWSRFEDFLAGHRGWEPAAPGGASIEERVAREGFTTSDRSLVLALRKDRLKEIVRHAGRDLTVAERKRLGVWVGNTVLALSRPWSEIGEGLVRTKKGR